MASLDFVTDLTDKLTSQKIDYAIVTVQRGSGGNKVHVFYNIPDIDAVSCIVEGIADLSEIAGELITEYEKQPKPKKKKKNNGDKE